MGIISIYESQGRARAVDLAKRLQICRCPVSYRSSEEGHITCCGSAYVASTLPITLELLGLSLHGV